MTTTHAPQAKSSELVHVPRIVTDKQMETAKTYLTPNDFKLLNEFISRLESPVTAPEHPRTLEAMDSLRKRINDYVGRAQLIQEIREQPETIENEVGGMARV